MSDEHFHAPPVDFGQCENTSELLPYMGSMMLPVGGRPTPSRAGDAFLIALLEGGDAPFGVVALGVEGAAAFYIGATATTLRSFAAQAMRAAEMLDGGAGKQ